MAVGEWDYHGTVGLPCGCLLALSFKRSGGLVRGPVWVLYGRTKCEADAAKECAHRFIRTRCQATHDRHACGYGGPHAGVPHTCATCRERW